LVEKPQVNSTIPSHDDCAAAIADAFSGFVGRGHRRAASGVKNAPKLAVAALSADINKCESALYTFISGEKQPSAITLLQCAAVLGPDFTNMLLVGIGQCGCVQVDSRGSAVLELLAVMNDATSKLANAASDGLIDHREAADTTGRLRAAANAMIATAEELEGVAKRGGSLSVIAPRR